MTTPTSSFSNTPSLATNGDQSPQKPAERLHAFQVAHSLGASFRYAGQGIYYALCTQRNFRIHALATILVIGLGIALRLPSVNIAVLGLTCGAVMALELINTALEAVVDLTVEQNYHELAKIAKDCAAAAVFVAALTAVLVGLCLLAPPLFTVLRLYFAA
jgi:diacylglycerol kinase (ATP)